MILDSTVPIGAAEALGAAPVSHPGSGMRVTARRGGPRARRRYAGPSCSRAHLAEHDFGGSGAGIRSFARPEELQGAELELGLDGTALVQERLPAEGEFIVRLEILDGELLALRRR